MKTSVEPGAENRQPAVASFTDSPPNPEPAAAQQHKFKIQNSIVDSNSNSNLNLTALPIGRKSMQLQSLLHSLWIHLLPQSITDKNKE